MQGVRGSQGQMNEIQALKEELDAAEKALRVAQFEHAEALQSKEAAQVGCKWTCLHHLEVKSTASCLDLSHCDRRLHQRDAS